MAVSLRTLKLMNNFNYTVMLKANGFGLFICFIVMLFSQCKKAEADSGEQGTIYYCSRQVPSGPWQVYKKNLNTGVTETITTNTGYNYWWVKLSPDHTRLLMMRSPYGSSPDQFNYPTCEMIKSNADGTNEQVIIHDNQYGWFAFGNPHWHPDGNRILLIVQAANSNNPFYIYSADTSGNNPRQLTTQWSIDANWSPDGKKIVFIGIGTSGQVPGNFEVFTADYRYTENQLSAIQQLTSDSTRNHDPCFSPDGSQIAFSASNASLTNADIVLINANGQNRTVVLDDNGIHGGPLNWGADGKVYHHSIYPGLTGFTVNTYDTRTKQYEALLASPTFGYISPYYFSK